MITKGNIISGVICGFICVIFMWSYMFFSMSSMSSENIKMSKMDNMHKMPDGSMMMNDGSKVEHNMMDMTMTDMVKMMEGKTGKALEKEFIAGMIPHHQGAVDMAKKLLEDKTINPEIAKFANEIIKAQESEINLMNGWLKKY